LSAKSWTVGKCFSVITESVGHMYNDDNNPNPDPSRVLTVMLTVLRP